jgi:hypothetical protein
VKSTGTPLVKEIQAELSNGDVRLFRNNTGQGWQGIQQAFSLGAPMRGRTITLEHARVIQFGLAEGSGDLIGFKCVTVTPDMVGQKVAVFVSIECKTGAGRMRKGQAAWLAMVRYFGGIADVARSRADAVFILAGGRRAK